MKQVTQRWLLVSRCERGDVLLEYVILVTLIVVPLVSLGMFNPTAGVDGDWGLFGEAFRIWYQRVVTGISLPVP